jgi:hypothetical protein
MNNPMTPPLQLAGGEGWEGVMLLQENLLKLKNLLPFRFQTELHPCDPMVLSCTIGFENERARDFFCIVKACSLGKAQD